MKVAIHQPAYIPYYGYFQKIWESDVFVILDDVQFSNNGYQNYNRIKKPGGEQNIRIPIVKKFGQKLCDVLVRDDIHWKEKHLKAFHMNYARAGHYHDIMPLLETVIKSNGRMLQEYCDDIVCGIVSRLMGDKHIIHSSSLNVCGSKSERIINICKAIGADTYLSGNGAVVYQTKDEYSAHGIKLEYIQLKPPKYRQQWGEFVPDLSFVDYLMNVGWEVPREWIIE